MYVFTFIEFWILTVKIFYNIQLHFYIYLLWNHAYKRLKSMKFFFFCHASTSRSTLWSVGEEGLILQLIKSQSTASTGGAKIADKVHSSFETTSQRALMDTLEQRWAIKFCTKIEKKSGKTSQILEQAKICLSKSTESLFYCMWKLQGGCKIYRRAKKGWTMTSRSVRPPTNQTDEIVTRVREFWPSNECSVVRWHSGHSENRCASHRYGWIGHVEGVHKAGWPDE